MAALKAGLPVAALGITLTFVFHTAVAADVIGVVLIWVGLNKRRRHDRH